jgi:hypothetical protein
MADWLAVALRTVLLLYAAMTVGVVLLGLRLDEESTASDAEAVALRWVDGGVAQEPRREGDLWEVDVVRPDGSVVQVSLGDDLELHGFDEESGPAGTLAADELRGAARGRAVQAAFAETGPGQVASVEYDSERVIGVCIREPTGRQVEVELDPMWRVIAVEREDPCDG